MKISLSFMLFLLLGAVSPSESTDYQKSFPQDIYAVLREMTASLVQLKADMRFLQTQEQAAQQKTEVDKLKKQLQVRQVAFSASLVVADPKTTGPFPTDTTLIFKHVVTNIGNAYNSNTGMFTAPVRGVYHFEWSVAAKGDNSHGSGAWLVKNTQNVFMAYEYEAYGFMSSSKAVALLLEVGDVVFVRLVAEGSNVAYDDKSHHTTFSGHLLFPM
ncbi:complement C1q-like protein 4 isoform X1 [Sander lucioperca]|uniref:complement C1q-like protein 4 isoform X1 n=1 Tax=Sander lucioperca TaxID=283035 RepID=UPI00165353AE|nr:complement C1q-like protein 4 isoform X1 [Sander lucioperca]